MTSPRDSPWLSEPLGQDETGLVSCCLRSPEKETLQWKSWGTWCLDSHLPHPGLVTELTVPLTHSGPPPAHWPGSPHTCSLLHQLLQTENISWEQGAFVSEGNAVLAEGGRAAREPGLSMRQVLAKGRFQLNTPRNVPAARASPSVHCPSQSQEVNGMDLQGQSLGMILYKERGEREVLYLKILRSWED